jgi:phosphogluconate dehydratase
MSGASGKVPSAIHVSPEAADGGPLAKVQDGDIIRLDVTKGTIDVVGIDLETRELAIADLTGNGNGVGRELFEVFRRNVGRASEGAGVVV